MGDQFLVMDQGATLVDIVECRAQRNPSQTAFTFLADGESREQHLTYAGLFARAQAIAAELLRQGLSGERVLIVCPQGLEYVCGFLGCLYADAVAVPAHTPGRGRHSGRLESIAADSGAKAALATGSILSQNSRLGGQNSQLAGLRWLDVDQIGFDRATADAIRIQASPDSVAYLQYTSGSTADPRGVMISHANLMANVEYIHEAASLAPGDGIVQWLPLFHDMGLVTAVYALYVGCPCTLLSPLHVIQQPLRWLKAVSRTGAVMSGGPNFIYELCAKVIPPDKRRSLDLANWRIAFTGAEPINSRTMRRFAGAFSEQGFRYDSFAPCYGLAESTLAVTIRNPAHPPRLFTAESAELRSGRVRGGRTNGATCLVSSGRTFHHHEVRIVDPKRCVPVEDEAVGEIWVSGPSVAAGYWNRQEESEAVFNARLEQSSGRFLRTGDIGFLKDGELYVTGRIKDLIIVRGMNHYPQDIEQTVEQCHPAVRPTGAAAFSVDVDHHEHVVVALELRHGTALDHEAIFEAVRTAVADAHSLEVAAVVLLKAGRLLKTTSGKIQRNACREAFLSGGFRGMVGEWRSQSFSAALGHGTAPRTNGRPKAGSISNAAGETLACPDKTAVSNDGSGKRNGAIAPDDDMMRAFMASTASLEPHYQEDYEFFRLVLGSENTLSSCGVWDGAATLADAQFEKLRRLADMACIGGNDRVLEIGCGWGDGLRFCVEQRKVRRATGLTIGRQEAGSLRARRSGLQERIELCSWLDFQCDKKYDALLCIEALQHFVSLRGRALNMHLPIYERFFEKCHELSTDSARLALQTVIVTKHSGNGNVLRDAAYLATMFPDSSLPDLDDILIASEGWYAPNDVISIGSDYAKTLAAWLENLSSHRDVIIQRYGMPLFDRYRRYFETSIRQFDGGYTDVLQMSFHKRFPRRASRRAWPCGAEFAHTPMAIAATTPDAAQNGSSLESPSAESIQQWMVARLAEKLEMPHEKIDVKKPFGAYGLDSLKAVSLVGELSDFLQRPLEPTIAWDYPNVELLSRHLAGETRGTGQKTDGNEQPLAEPIAVVGIACRFPGADNPDAFERLLRYRGDAVSEVPADRWDAEGLYNPNPDNRGTMTTKWLGALKDIDQFDASFFGITPREAKRMDPQQRLLVEVTWQALEDAGFVPEKVAGSRTGVYVGIGGYDYSTLQLKYENYIERIDAYTGTGNTHSIAANRLSYLFDFQGPSMAVDTACSSSLVALHLACQSLRSRECDTALAAGVNVILTPEVSVAFSKARMLSPDGRCKSFDDEANGYVRGEGCGVVLLKRLDDAIQDGDRILAVVRGVATNQDGRTSGITAPSGLRQQAVMRTALAQAGVSPDQLSYIEAHGTGTALGDPIEVNAIKEVLGTRTEGAPPCYIGSVKANIGHLETASGMAGLIKLILMLQKRVIYPQMHWNKLNHHLSLDQSPLRISTELCDWQPIDGRCRAGISSFGFGGTNVHAILEEAPAAREPQPPRTADRPRHMLTVSARSDAAVKKLARRYLDELKSGNYPSLANFCFTANAGRSHFPHRLAIVGQDFREHQDCLEAFLASQKVAGITTGHVDGFERPKLAFLFTGQGSQYPGMAKQFYDTQPAFRSTINRCHEILQSHMDRPLLEILFPASKDDSSVNETVFTQPALFSIEYALAQLWISWGVRPDFVLGHSIGEYVAACIAGVFSLEDGLKLVAQRARLMHEMPGNGHMAVVLAGEAVVAPLLKDHANEVSIAAVNGPEAVVISGHGPAVERIVEMLQGRNVTTSWLNVSHAFHSPVMEPMCARFEEIALDIEYHIPTIPLVSNVFGAFLSSEDCIDGSYWSDHVRKPVLFMAGMNALVHQGCSVFLEVGPNPDLISLGRRCAPGKEFQWLPTVRKGTDEWRLMLESLATLYVRGVPVDWAGFDKGYSRNRCALPTYPFERERFWMDDLPQEGARTTPARRIAADAKKPSLHPLVQRRLHSAVSMAQFDSAIDLALLRYLKDHKVHGSVLFPAAGYLEMARAAGEQIFGDGQISVEDVLFQQALFLADDNAPAVQVIVAPEVAGKSAFQIFSQPADASAEWTLNVSGTLSRGIHSLPDEPRGTIDVEKLRSRCDGAWLGEALYRKLEERGLEYGPAFQNVTQVYQGDGEAIGRVEPAAPIEQELSAYGMHPAILDACFHVLAAAVDEQALGQASRDTFVPVGVKRVCLRKMPSGPFWVLASIENQSDRTETSEFEGNILLVDDQGDVIAQIDRLRLARLGGKPGEMEPDTRRANRLGDCVYRMQWLLRELPDAAVADNQAPTIPVGNWLIYADRGGLGAGLAELLERRGCQCVLVSQGSSFEQLSARHLQVDASDIPDVGSLIQRAFGADSDPCRGVMHLWNLDTEFSEDVTADDLITAARQCCGSLITMIKQLTKARGKAPRLFVVTRDAHAIDGKKAMVNVNQSMTWGLLRTISREHPEFNGVYIDLDADGNVETDSELLSKEIWTPDPKDHVAWRGSQRYVGRVTRCNADDLERGVDQIKHSDAEAVVRSGQPFRLEIAAAGTLDGLAVRPTRRVPPGRGLVEIEVRATGLNFSDVMKVMGLYPGITDTVVPLGIECAGTISAVGEGVEGFKIGDEVLALGPFCFSRWALVPSHGVVHKPANLSYDEAATLPVAYLTAYYALHYLGRIAKGERVLIHAAAGGVGQAAIQIAHAAGAEVFATAGTPEKRDFLKQQGVAHVMDSRSTDFDEEIMRVTGHKGVDLVLNSLAGQAVAKSLGVLGAYGRFLEIGKTEIYMNRMMGLHPFQNNLSYFAIDMDRLYRQRPQTIVDLLADIMKHVEAGQYGPLPMTRYPITDAVGAFRYMAQRKNIGKIIVTSAGLEAASTAEPVHAPGIKADATYLITGGLGSLGVQVAERLVEDGARHLALLARSEPSSKAQTVLSRLREADVDVRVFPVDVAVADALAAVMTDIKASMPPLAGVVHAAGVLDDGVMLHLSWERFERVLTPKVRGAWNLHKETRDADLDFFICFSSAASLLGSNGQGNYAVANAFLDGLAHYRRQLGLPGLSINWGPWEAGGMADNSIRSHELAARGFTPLRPKEGLWILDRLARTDEAQFGVMDLDWNIALKSYRDGVPPLVEYMEAERTASNTQSDEAMRAEIIKKLRAIDPAARVETLSSDFRERLAEVVGLEPHRIDPRVPLSTLGLDSLMVFELKNSIESRLGVTLSVAKFFEDPSLIQLTEYVLELLEERLSNPQTQVAVQDAGTNN